MIEVRGSLVDGKGTALENTSSFNLEVIVEIDPCSLTVLDDLLLTDMTAYVLKGEVSQTFAEVQDSESSTNGDPNWCGPRLYSLLGAPPFVSLDSQQREITVLATEMS